MKRSETFGAATVWLGEAHDIREVVDEQSIDLLWTDPPYGNQNNGKGLTRDTKRWRGIEDKTQAAQIENDDDVGMSVAIRDMAWSVMGLDGSGQVPLMARESAICIMTAGGGPTPSFARLITEATSEWDMAFFHSVVWHKLDPGLGWRYRNGYEFVHVFHPLNGTLKWTRGKEGVSNVISMALNKKRLHPNQKPVPLVMSFIANHTHTNDLVVDPFMGSGTTGIAALMTGRRFIGIESEERWFDLACRRLEHEARQSSLHDLVQERQQTLRDLAQTLVEDPA